MLDRSAESAPDVRRLASEVIDPANPTTSMELKRADLADHHVASVQAFVGLCREEVWTPFVKSGLPTEQWHTIADRTTQLRPLAIGLGIQAFRRAIDEVVGKVAAEEAAKLS